VGFFRRLFKRDAPDKVEQALIAIETAANEVARDGRNVAAENDIANNIPAVETVVQELPHLALQVTKLKSSLAKLRDEKTDLTSRMIERNEILLAVMTIRSGVSASHLRK
jgi:hypothetical protein